ncbi:MAG: 16S rRNA (cytosine(1402)-N(4))-methyltransferase RsmH [Patescibacteria group bacterium]|nr:16S rRNA (cytosine(1402)-N(4))-methyltransferase RsmH [Patescibacteria group bacterium]
MHHPVLLDQVMDRLMVRSGGRYIDATFGEGGHSQEILRRGGIVLGIDLDPDQVKRAINQKILHQFGDSLKLVKGNFAEIDKIAVNNQFFMVDGVIFDLGLSMGQLENSGRGFSYKKTNEVLDMRLDPDQTLTALELIKKTSVEELENIFSRFGEEVNSRKIALSIVRLRKKIACVGDLILAIDQALGYSSQKTYARVFQALRIVVNNELENLKKGLQRALKLVKKGGRIVVISFQSLEDRIVKKFIRDNQLILIDKKPISGLFSYERSAKLRTILV